MITFSRRPTVVGDMTLKKLEKDTDNVGGYEWKNVRICSSGVYDYAPSEMSRFKIDMSGCPAGLDKIGVLRPKQLLREQKDRFARVPIIAGHHQLVHSGNAKGLTTGMVGDTVDVEEDREDGELYVYTTATLVADEAIKMAEEYGELSVGYFPSAKWESGVHNGKAYQAVMTDLGDVNHLLLCKTARGGHKCMVLDEVLVRGGFLANLLTGGKTMGLFGKKKGKRDVVGDSKPEVVSALLQSITAGADPKTQVGKVRELIAAVPVGDSKKTFEEYLTDIEEHAGSATAEMKKFAIQTADDYYQQHIVADSKDEDKKPEDKKPEDKDKKPEGDSDKDEDKDKKPEGDEVCPECKKTPCICDSKDKKPEGDAKPAGDSKPDLNEVIAEAIKQGIAEGMKSLKPPVTVVGDQVVENPAAIREMSMRITGDEKKTAGADDFFNEIFKGGAK